MNNRPSETRQSRLGLATGLALVAGSTMTFAGCQLVAASPAPSAHTAVFQSEGNDLEEGTLPSRATAFDEDIPGIAKLDPQLLDALQQATRDARADNVDIFVNSGWRAPELQARMLEEAVEDYGSREEAAQWVATPETSAHVSGDAVDVGEMDAYLWLSERDRGAAYGLCQIYSNEPWHFEYRAEALTEGCPEQYLDPTYDPAMQG